MEFNLEYLAVIANSTIRMTTPILLVTLAAAICSKVKIFNIAMEGTMLTGAFFSIVANYFTGSVFVSVLAGVVSSMLISALVGFCVIKLKASAVVVGMAVNTMMGGVTTYLMYLIFKTKGVFSDPSLVSLPKIDLPLIQDVVVGMAVNTMMGGVTTYLMYLIFKTKGVFSDPSLVSLPKIDLPLIQDIPFVGTMLSGLTIIDYLAVAIAIGMYFFLYKTVLGFRLRAYLL